jgi:hypothetical protein
MNTIISEVKTAEAPHLPLDWTQVKPRRRQDDESDERRGPRCCEGVNNNNIPCRISRHRFRRDTQEDGIQGHVVFCLHEMNPSWFQGYFLPRGTTRQPWRLLAVQEEIEDCLACADGGFRRVSLTLYPPPPPLSSGRPIKLDTVDWVGGDLIRFHHEQLEVESNRIWTGESSLPLVETYFKALVQKLRIECEVEEHEPILQWLPDIAIVSGQMMFVLPKGGEDDDDE